MKIIVSESQYKKIIQSLQEDEEKTSTLEKALKFILPLTKSEKEKDETSVDDSQEKFDASTDTYDADSQEKSIVVGNKLDIKNKFSFDLINGPKHHSSTRPKGNWESDNAWDMFAPAGTDVLSFTKGIVRKKIDYNQNKGTVYGIGVVVTGTDGYPDIFYTHMKNVKLNKGDKVDVGDYIGEISEWKGHDPEGEHVHVGLPYGKHIRDYIA